MSTVKQHALGFIIAGWLLVSAIILWPILPSAKGQSSSQGQLAVDVELRGNGANGSTRNDCQQVTFIFRSSYTGNIGGVAFTSTDVPLTIKAEHGNVLRAIPYTVTAGNLVVVSTH